MPQFETSADERDSLVRELLSLRQQLAGANAEVEKYRLREWSAYQALGYSPPVNDALPHLIECMMGLKARLQDSLDSIERATGFQPGTESLATWVGHMVAVNNVLVETLREIRDLCQITGLTPERGWIMSVELAQQALITAKKLGL